MEIQIEDMGKPDGCFEDLTNYLKSALDDKDEESAIKFGIAIDTLKDKFGVEITTKFLRELMPNRKNKNGRIAYLIKKSEFRTLPIKRYRKGLLNSKVVRNEKIYKDYKGKVEIVKENIRTIGIFHYGRWAETLHRIVPKEEYDKVIQRLSEIRQKHTGELENSQVVDNLTHRQERAVERLRQSQERFIVVNCERCKHEIKYPTTPNLETDKWEELVSGIYNLSIRNRKMCWRCGEKVKNDDNWKVPEIIEVLEKLVSGKCYQFPAEEFCKKFRAYGDLVDIGYIKRKLSGWLLNAEVKTEGENMLKIKIR